MTILNDIVQNTREKLVHKKIEVPLEKIKLQLDSLKLPKGAFKENQFLMDVKAVSKLPIIRKDFMIDEYQIYEAKLMGADCILLIVSVLSDDEITQFVEVAESLELDYLIEVHDEDELKRVEHFENAIIGVNNRDLKTFEVDLNNSVNLKSSFSGKNLFVAESGIKNQSDIDSLKEHDINVFLIGESLMKGDFV